MSLFVFDSLLGTPFQLRRQTNLRFTDGGGYPL